MLILLAPLVAFFGADAPPPPSPEASNFQLVGSVRYSDWSKTHLGDHRTELQAPGLLQTVELGERGDKPCYVKATFLRPAGGTLTRVLDECGNRGPTSRSRVTLGNVSSASAPHGIYSIQACITDNQRLKGLRLQRKNLVFASNGTASSGQEYRRLELKRTNCSLSTFGGWDDDTPACPTTSSGTPTYAVGLGLALRRGSLYNVRLMCKEVRRSSSAPARRGRLGRN
ncbi:MAG: hypothetical protein AAF170_12730 [Bacteroidota bacterium]